MLYSKDSAVIFSSPFGDTDINVLACSCYKITRVNYLLNMVQGVTKRDVGLKISH